MLPMPLSRSTEELLTALDDFSSSRLTRRDDLGILLEAAKTSGTLAGLDELSFLAKFAHRTYGIMQRIGKDGQGYEGLWREFTGAVERSQALAGRILESSPPAARDLFTRRYLVMSPGSLEEFLALCYDLSWYKNWNIDRPGGSHLPGGRT
jgi:hypothetical protein